MNEHVAVLWALSQISGITWKFLSGFSWEPADLGKYSFLVQQGLAPKYAERAVDAVSSFDMHEKSRELANGRITPLTILDAGYPETLRNIYAPPLILFVRGRLPQNLPMVAVVGARKATPYGRQVVEAVVPPLVAGGVVTVSGLARGIDTLAHVVTLRNGGVTVAVLGSGVNCVYPEENRQLADRIVEQGGAVISEYSPNDSPRNYYFPARNRIISGLSKVTIIVEGDRNSGSLITAEHAMEQGKDVVAVPGSIFSSQSRGPNWLISQGATPLTDPLVPLELLGISLAEQQEDAGEDLQPLSRLLLTTLSREPRDVDSLVTTTGLLVSDVLVQLSELELAQLVERLPGGKYIALKPHG